MRGVALTDALIGTFAGAHDPDLRQNRCFLYHVIGNGSGTGTCPWAAWARSPPSSRRPRAAAGAELRCGAEVDRDRPGPATASRCASPTRAAAGSVAAGGHVLANVAPAVLDRLRGRRAVGHAARGRAAEGQPAARAAAAAARRAPSTRPTPSPGTFHVNEGYDQLERARAQAAAGRAARRRAVRDLLPLAHRPEHPRPRAAGRGRADADAASPCTCPRGCSRPTPTARASARSSRHPGVAGQRARRARARLRVARPRRAPVHRGAHPARPRGRARPAGRQHLPPRPELAVRRDRGRGRHLGRGDRRTRACSSAAPARAAAAGSAACPGATRRWPCCAGLGGGQRPDRPRSGGSRAGRRSGRSAGHPRPADRPRHRVVATPAPRSPCPVSYAIVIGPSSACSSAIHSTAMTSGMTHGAARRRGNTSRSVSGRRPGVSGKATPVSSSEQLPQPRARSRRRCAAPLRPTSVGCPRCSWKPSGPT